jgi:hypothetical protein
VIVVLLIPSVFSIPACLFVVMCFLIVPTAADLISLFLYQADVSANIAREINGKESISMNGGNQV